MTLSFREFEISTNADKELIQKNITYRFNKLKLYLIFQHIGSECTRHIIGVTNNNKLKIDGCTTRIT